MTTATIKHFDGAAWRTVTGNVVKRYERGLTIDDERGVRYYATLDRVLQTETDAPEVRGLLW